MTRDEEECKKCFNSLASDSDLSVRLSFVKSIPKFLSILPPNTLQYHLLKLYVKQYNIKNEFSSLKMTQGQTPTPNQKLLLTLTDSLVDEELLIAVVHEPKLCNSSMNQILQFANSFTSRWRFIKKFLAAFEKFPLEILNPKLKDVLKLIENSVSLNPEALFSSVCSFYNFMLDNTEGEQNISEYMEYLVKKYAFSTKFELRRLYVQFSCRLIERVPDDIFLSVIWPPYLEQLSQERVVNVKSKILEFLPQFYTHISKSTDKKLSIQVKFICEQISSLLNVFSKETDPLLRSLFTQAQSIIPPAKSRDPPLNLTLTSVSPNNLSTPYIRHTISPRNSNMSSNITFIRNSPKESPKTSPRNQQSIFSTRKYTFPAQSPSGKMSPCSSNLPPIQMRKSMSSSNTAKLAECAERPSGRSYDRTGSSRVTGPTYDRTSSSRANGAPPVYKSDKRDNPMRNSKGSVQIKKMPK